MQLPPPPRKVGTPRKVVEKCILPMKNMVTQ